MITLYGFGPGFGLPEISPYVTKTEVQLHMAGLAYRKEVSRPASSPKGQLPYIRDDNELVADSTFIRTYLERKYGIDVDARLDPVERAQAWAIERMLENHFGWTVLQGRWLIDENFAKGPAHFADEAPEGMRPRLREEMRQRVADRIYAVGIGRHLPDEIIDLGERSLAALSALLDRRYYLMGEEPCGADAIAFGLLAGLLTPFFESALRRRAENYGNLTAYVDRMMWRYYPDHPWEGCGHPSAWVAARAAMARQVRYA